MTHLAGRATPARATRVVRWTAAVTAVAAFALGGWALFSDQPQLRMVLWGLTGTTWFLISLVLGMAATAVALCTLPGLWRWAAIVPTGAAMVMFVVAGVGADPQFVNLRVDGCTSPYLVEEQHGLHELHGLHVTEVLSFPSENTTGVFRGGHYRAEVRGESVDVRYESTSARWPRSITDDPAFTLPAAPLSCR